MTDYMADYAVFERMPDTATKAEIRAAIEADRATRQPTRCTAWSWDTLIGRVECARPFGHRGEHDERSTS